MSFPKKPGGKALDALQNLPRITLANLRPEPGSKKSVGFNVSLLIVLAAQCSFDSLLASYVSQWRQVLTFCQFFRLNNARSSLHKTILLRFFDCRTNDEAEDSMVATEAVEDIKESDREAPGQGWVLRGVRLPFTCPSRNIASMKDTGKSLSLCSLPFKLVSDCLKSKTWSLLFQVTQIKR